MSIVLNGEKVATPGLETVSWLDDPKVPLTKDVNPRTQWLRAIVMHTVAGKVGKLLPGFSKPSTRAESYAKYQANTSRDVSWDYTIDTDGTIVASNDPIKFYTWQATSVNPFTLGIELVQEDNGDLYEGQISVAVRFLDLLTRELSDRGHPIQRQVPMSLNGTPVKGVISRIANAETAKQVVGVYGHRNQTSNRGAGDPGDFIFDALLKAGYKGFNLETKDDVIFWKDIQTKLGLTPADGIPGRDTQKALLAAGYKHGLMVNRPGD
jgi:N-acetylmuramoyl-L-alanine amidase